MSAQEFSTDIVISGLSGRYPNSNNLSEFWNNLISGAPLTTSSNDRWPLGYMGLPKVIGMIPETTKFDSEFFGMSDKDTLNMSCLMRLLKESTFEAIFDASIDPESLRGDRTGLFTGYCYETSSVTDDLPLQNLHSEVAKSFGISGPCVCVDSACATGVSAFHEAFTHLRLGMIDTAIVGAFSLNFSPYLAKGFTNMGMNSYDGASRCLDANAFGYCRAEAIVSIIIQRKSVARRSYAEILNTKTNSDGFKPESITFPSIAGQTCLIKETYDSIGLDTLKVKYIEAHMTGTGAGDPVESQSICNAFCDDRRKEPLLIGCLKSNMGHSEGVAGLAALTKACLVLQKGMIPPNIHFNKPNPNIRPLIEGKIAPVLKTMPFEGDLIGVNNFGFGGSNVHVILRRNEKSAHEKEITRGSLPRLVNLCSRTQEGLHEMIAFIKNNPSQVTNDFLALINENSKFTPERGFHYRSSVILDESKHITWRQDSELTQRRDVSSLELNGTNNFFMTEVMREVYEDVMGHSLMTKNPIDINQNKIIDDVPHGSPSEVDALKLFAHLYLNGYNPSIEKLYPKVEYPVSRETPSLSPFMKWKHDKEYQFAKYPDVYNMFSTSFLKYISLDDPEFSFIVGHTIDKRVLFPATGYLFLVWESVALVHEGDDGYLKVNVEFKNVNLVRATIVPKDGKITFFIKYLESTGEFSVNEGGSVCATGFMHILNDCDLEKMNSSVNEIIESVGQQETQDNIILTTPDVYKELRISGYDYGTSFQGIQQVSHDGLRSKVKWTGHFISFADCVAQTAIVSNMKDRELLLPTFIESLKVDIRTLMKQVENDKKEFDVFYDKDVGVVCCNPGIVMKGLKISHAPRRFPEPTVDSLVFVPYEEMVTFNEETQEKIEEYTSLMNDLLDAYQNNHLNGNGIEINPKFKLLKALSTVEQENKSIEDVLMKSKHEIMDDYMMTLFESNESMIKHVMETVHENLSYKRKLELIEYNASDRVLGKSIVNTIEFKETQFKTKVVKDYDDLKKCDMMKEDIIVFRDSSLDYSFMADDDRTDVSMHQFLTEMIHKISEGSFIWLLFRTKMFDFEDRLSDLIKKSAIRFPSLTEVTFYASMTGFMQISLKRDQNGFVSLLLRKPVADDQKIIQIKFDHEYEWVHQLQKSLLETSEDSKAKIWITSFEAKHGLIGFMKCLMKESKNDKVRLFVSDEDMEENNNHEFKIPHEILKKDLFFNVYRDGSLGSFRHKRQDNLIMTELTSDAYLDVETKGDLSSLKYYKSNHYKQKSNKMACVYYSALNFKDVMIATGRIPLSAYPEGHGSSGCLGMEYSGIDPDGNRVALISDSNCISFSAQLNDFFKWTIPDDMSLEDSATIPVVYMTVYYALFIRGKMEKGESILIHSGTGGVGQAALHVCSSMDCDIYTTVGSDEKKNFLLQKFSNLKSDHIFSSRNTKFESKILQLTDGRGVDLVLNSLTGDKLKAGLNCLSDFGRFLEIGKYDIVSDTRFHHCDLEYNKTYDVICLAHVMDSISKGLNPYLGIQLKTMIQEGINSGVIKALPTHIFNYEQAEDAFRFMASGKHVGKVLIQMRDEHVSLSSSMPLVHAVKRSYFDPDRCYIITGGLGGMGLELGLWLLERGARNLILTSRRGISNSYQEFCIKRFRTFGGRIEVLKLDVSKEHEAKEILETATNIAPVGGIFHLVLQLSDGLLENLTLQQFKEACVAKVDGTIHLDRMSRLMCPLLEHFVCFSSVTSGEGNAGQSNYGYANSFMESLCEERKSSGLPGLVVQWGIVGDVGFVADAGFVNEAMNVFGSQRIVSCLHTLERLMQMPEAVYTSLVKSEKKGGSGDEKDILKRICHVLGIKNASEVSPKTTLGELGLDSLMAVEVRQLLERDYDTVLNVQEVRSLTVERIRSLKKNDRSDQDAPHLDIMNEQKKSIVSSQNFYLLNGVESDACAILVFPGGEGSFEELKKITSHIKNRPVYGAIYSSVIDDMASMQDIATYFMNDILKYTQSFDLIGLSYGSCICLEMGLQLQRLFGPSVMSRMLLLDGSPTFVKHFTVDIENLTSEKAAEVLKRDVPENYFGRFGKNETSELLKKASKRNRQMKSYEMNDKFVGNVKLIRSTRGFEWDSQTNSYSDDYDLSQFITGSVEVKKFEGNHYSFMMDNEEKIGKEVSSYFIIQMG